MAEEPFLLFYKLLFKIQFVEQTLNTRTPVPNKELEFH